MVFENIFRLDGKISVVVGGNGYLGRRYCKCLLEYGAKVYVIDKNVEKNDETQEMIDSYPNSYFLNECDASKKGDLEKIRDHIVKKEGKVNILVNTTTLKSKDFYLPFEEVSLEGWNIGLLGEVTIPFLVIQAFIPIMKKQKAGSIINTASIYGIVGNDQRLYEGSNLHKLYVKDYPDIKRVYANGVYCAGNGGLINFTKYLSAYYGKDNIRINCISPGGLSHEGENDTFVKKYSEKTPLGRKANRGEIVGALIYLASDASKYTTGHNLVVDGGWTAW